MSKKVVLSMTIVAVILAIAGCVSTLHSHIPWREHQPTSSKGRAYAHYIASVVYERQGNLEKALTEMEKTAELDQEAFTPALRLIRAHLRSKNYEDALAMSERLVQQAPERANLWVVRGEILHKLGRPNEAMQAFMKAIEVNPENILGYGALIELQESLNDLVAAIEVYERLVELSPDAPGLYYQLGINLARINDVEGASAALSKALELNPRLSRARYLLGVMALEHNQNERAIAYLTAYLRSRQDDVQAMEHLAGAWERIGRGAQALELYNNLLLSPQATPHHHIQAMYVALIAGEPQRVSTYRPQTSAPILGYLFQLWAQEDTGESTEGLLAQLDTIEGDLDTECSEYVNDLLYLFGKKEAGDYLLKRLTTSSQKQDTRTLPVIQARLLMSLGRHEEAIPLLEEVLARYEKEQHWIHYYLAICHDDLDHFEAAEKHLQAYLQFQPDDPEVWNFLGYLYAEEGVKLKKAEELLQKALEMEPENPYYLDSLGWIYYKMGRGKKAVEYIQEAIYKMDNDDAMLRDHLGDAFLLIGDKERAAAEWERALRLDSDLKGVKEKLERSTNRK